MTEIIKDTACFPSRNPIPDVAVVPSGIVRQAESVPFLIPLLAAEEGELVITEDGYCIDLTRIYG